ncbi:50S ribosomal protein L20 [Candidatus Gromoviella agglomerans]|uniref:50S ribosomal protein L20 n=1 Tax=Candidatus Gromoviella agglomerans TaxID=2806609 RepID=UPI001E61E70A|nr:50S ribosomal protein L20 [Candidatus Gromoviella agglomerans]UFX98365.1 50S ribosomal protein L20 [Candidatus Gromoviella agglomerans]
MSRVKGGVQSRKRRKKVISMAKGFRGRSKNCYRIAMERLEKALQYSYRDRRNKKREFRALWIQRINAAVRSVGLTYSKFMHLLAKSDVQIDRKSLSNLAVYNADVFEEIVRKVSS